MSLSSSLKKEGHPSVQQGGDDMVLSLVECKDKQINAISAAWARFFYCNSQPDGQVECERVPSSTVSNNEQTRTQTPTAIYKTKPLNV